MKDRKDWWQEWFGVWGLLSCVASVFIDLLISLCGKTLCFPTTWIVIKIFMAITLVMAVVLHFIDYVHVNKQTETNVRIKFKHFEDIYYVNPDNWCMFQVTSDDDYWRPMYRPSRRKSYVVTFSYFDWLRFCLFRMVKHGREKRQEKLEAEQRRNQRLAEMLAYVQQDINNVYEKIEKIEPKEQKNETISSLVF